MFMNNLFSFDMRSSLAICEQFAFLFFNCIPTHSLNIRAYTNSLFYAITRFQFLLLVSVCSHTSHISVLTWVCTSKVVSVIVPIYDVILFLLL